MKSLLTTLLLLSLGTSFCFGQQHALDRYIYFCEGSDSVLLSVDSLTNPGCNYSWYRGGILIAANTSEAHLFVTDTGSYTVVAHTPQGCSSDFSNALIVRFKSLHAQDDSVSVRYSRTVAIDILENDSMACAAFDTASILIEDSPRHGDLRIVEGRVIYKHDMDYTGVDSFEYTVSDINGHVSNIAKVQITIGAVPNTEQEDISIYPNPASDFLYVKGDPAKIASIMLVTDGGRVIYETVPVKDITAIPVRHYARALYLVRIVYKSGKQTGHKVIVGNE